MVSPYVSAQSLAAAPAGLSWQVVPTLTASTQQQQAQLEDVVRIASSQVDAFCHQPLRATVNTETITGPGRGRLSVDPGTGIASVVTRRWPVAQVLAVQTSPARSFPPSWTPVRGGSVGHPLPGATSPFAAPQSTASGGNVIDLAPGVVAAGNGRGGAAPRACVPVRVGARRPHHNGARRRDDHARR